MEFYMCEALNEAKLSLEKGEVPIGCVFVYNNEIIAKCGNYVNQFKNATCHAEMICIEEIFKYCKINKLNYKNVFSKTSCIVTVEPCIMCSAALHNLNIKEIIFGSKNPRFGGTTILNVSKILENENISFKGGIKSDEAINLLKQFYTYKNPSAPITKATEKKLRKTSTDNKIQFSQFKALACSKLQKENQFVSELLCSQSSNIRKDLNSKSSNYDLQLELIELMKKSFILNKISHSYLKSRTQE